jgi:hypothetical protein
MNVEMEGRVDSTPAYINENQWIGKIAFPFTVKLLFKVTTHTKKRSFSIKANSNYLHLANKADGEKEAFHRSNM